MKQMQTTGWLAGLAALTLLVTPDTPAVKAADEAAAALTPGKKVELFNGKDFAGWRLFLPGDADPKQTWSVKDGVVVCTGKPAGYMRTEQRWKDYKLRFEWRWPGEPANSGTLLHIQDFDQVWPRCIEAQLKHRDAGDFITMGQEQVDAVKGTTNRRVPKMNPSNEAEPGKWNTMEITCKGNTIEVKVNGVLQNKATGSTVQQGFIGLQSEGGPIEFRHITLEPAG